MDIDPVTLARIQFATNISFHILFPTITIALGWTLLWFKLRYRRSGDAAWLNVYRLWVKVFAVSFAMGVVSGVTMSFQFGTNWPGFMERVGNIAGPLLAYEVLTAFFLEATFLSIMLFGIGRVSDRLHTIATLLVAVGTTLSAFWILVLNSWMQTPVGFEMRDGVAHATDWAAIVFNPSMPYRLVHMLLASGLTVAFLICGLSAYRWLRGDHGADVRLSLRFGCTLAAVLIPLQILAGDLHGLNTLKHQPAKVAAMEGLWETTRGAPLLLFAVPDEERRENRYEVAIPAGASLILTHELDGELRGLNDFEERHPPVAPVFWSFRVMVGAGVAMLVASWLAVWQLRRHGALSPLMLRALTFMTFSGWVATLAGWYVTEIGRQPWLVSGVLLTRDAASTVPAPLIGISLSMYLTLYLLLLSAYVSVLFYLARKAGAPAGSSVSPTPTAGADGSLTHA
jgi:cytochrome d ubiquinol oxidase subunit I